MRVTEKTDELFQRIKEISDSCFEGVERPPEFVLRYEFDHGDIFTRSAGFTKDSERIVSFALVTRTTGHPYLWSLATLKSWRAYGFGSALLQQIIKYYHDQHETQIDLTVNVNNPAQKLYFDNGFRAVTVKPHYYGELPGLRMRRTL